MSTNKNEFIYQNMVCSIVSFGQNVLFLLILKLSETIVEIIQTLPILVNSAHQLCHHLDHGSVLIFDLVCQVSL